VSTLEQGPGSRRTDAYRHPRPGHRPESRHPEILRAPGIAPGAAAGQRLGFSLQEITANLKDVERAADPDAYLQELLRDKLRVIEARIDELQALRGVLYSRLGEACPLRG